MPKTRQKKESLVAELITALKDSKGAVFADFTGLTVKEISELRKILREQGIAYEVLKKTLLAKSLDKVQINGLSVDNFVGSISLATSPNDEVAPAKLLVEFAKKHEKLQILGGLMNQSFVGQEQVKFLAKLPSKQELLGKLVGTITAPAVGLLRVLSGNLRGLLQILSTLAQKSTTK